MRMLLLLQNYVHDCYFKFLTSGDQKNTHRTFKCRGVAELTSTWAWKQTTEHRLQKTQKLLAAAQNANESP